MTRVHAIWSVAESPRNKPIEVVDRNAETDAPMGVPPKQITAIIEAMSQSIRHNLLIEASEPMLQPTHSRLELFRLGCRAAGLREYPDKAIVPGFAAADARFATLPRPLATWEDEVSFWISYYGEVLATLGQSASNDQLRTLAKALASHQAVGVSPSLPPMIQAVRRRGGRAVLVADWYASFRQTLINSGLLGLFPEVYLAGQKGVYLEDQEGVLSMLRTLGLQPETVTFLGSPRSAMTEVGIACWDGDRAGELVFS